MGRGKERCSYIAIFLWLLLAATFLHGQTDPLGPPEAVFYNGKVITVDSGFSIRQAFVIRGDRFLGVGSNADMRSLAGQGTRLVDLHGRAVVPGLMDNHNHQYRAITRLAAETMKNQARTVIAMGHRGLSSTARVEGEASAANLALMFFRLNRISHHMPMASGTP